MDMSQLLLIIDMQEGFRSKQTDQITPIIQKLSNSFKGPALYSMFVNQKSSLFENQLEWMCFQDTKDQKILDELNNETIQTISHTGYTVLTDELKTWIKDNSIQSVYLSGVYTDVCITKTAMDLFDNGIKAFIIKDACHSLHGEQHHNITIDSLSHILGKDQIITSRELTVR